MQRDPQPEAGAAPFLGLHLDRATASFDYLLDGGQAQSGAEGLGAEERLEDAAQMVRRDAGPSVRDRNLEALILEPSADGDPRTGSRAKSCSNPRTMQPTPASTAS